MRLVIRPFARGNLLAVPLGLAFLVSCGGGQPGPASISVFPSVPYSSDTITVSIDRFAVDGSGGELLDKSNNYEYNWFRDDERIDEADGASLSADLTLPGQNWRVTVTPVNGELYGPASSYDFKINTPPSATVSLPATTTRVEDLSLVPEGLDIDGDAVDYDVVWSYKAPNGEEGVWTDASGSPANALTLPAVELGAVGTVWTAQVTPYTAVVDNEGVQKEGAKGELVYANSTVVNQAPVLTSVELSPAVARVTDTMTATVVAEDGDSDPLTYDFSWFVDGVEVLTTTASSTASDEAVAGFATKGQEVQVSVLVDDGFETASVSSSPVILANSPPTIGSVTLSAGNAADVLTCFGQTKDDPDGDTVYETYQWLIFDGQTTAYSQEKSSTLSGEFAKGDEVTCKITPDDLDPSGNNLGSPVEATVTIVNAPPVLHSAMISPSPAIAGDTLSCAYTPESDADIDIDGDAVTFDFQWRVNGSGAGQDQTLSEGFGRGDTVECTVTLLTERMSACRSVTLFKSVTPYLG